jgi:DNA-directed RNA polymerase III subunit RPC8
VGLCISFYDFIEVGDPYIYPAEGAAHQHVRFRLVIFRPFAGEVIVGKIVGSNRNGIKISVEFFEDIFVPAYLFPIPSVFNSQNSLWTWKYGEGFDQQDFIMELGDEVVIYYIII